MKDAAYWIEKLHLLRHPEGGYYRETYRSAETIPANGLPARYGGARSVSTSIYFLLKAGEVSKLHRIRSDEVWHYHAGGTLRVHVLEPEKGYWFFDVGAETEFQAMVPFGAWFGAEVLTGNFVLVGCTVAPGFDFQDFEMADRSLSGQYPAQRELIERLTTA